MCKSRFIQSRLFLFLIIQALVALLAVVAVSAAAPDAARIPGSDSPRAGYVLPSTPFLQAALPLPVDPLQEPPTTLQISIVSSPWALLDHNTPETKGPHVLVLEAAVTNIGPNTAEDFYVNLNYNENPINNWVLLSGEDPERALPTLGAGETYHAYWFATYPPTRPSIGATHQYTVTAGAANAPSVATSTNAYRPTGPTLQIRRALEGGSTRLREVTSEMIVGAAFTATVEWNLGTNPAQVLFSPVGNVDFDPSSYRLVHSQVTFLQGTTPLSSVDDRLYFNTVPDNVDGARAEFVFLALRPLDARICPYAAPLTSDFKYDNSFCTPSIPVEATVSLSLTKQVNAAYLQQGQPLTYTIAYTNNGTMKLANVWIWDDIDAAIGSVITPSIHPVTDLVTATLQRVAWFVDEIPASGQPGSTGTLAFTILVDGGGQDLLDQTPVVNDAFFGIDPGGLPANAALTSTVTSTIQAPLMALAKTDELDEVNVGGELVYTLRITNSGSMTATSAIITDRLPDGVSHPGGPILTWALDPIPPHGGHELLTIPATVDPVLPDGTILTNIVTATYENLADWAFDPITATDSTTVRAPFWVITKSDVPDPVVAGTFLTYTLSYYHNGLIPATGITLVDTLPNEVTYDRLISQPAGWSAPTYDAGPPATLTWSRPALTAGASGNILVRVTVNSDVTGVIANQARITSTDPTTYTTTSENSAVIARTDLAIVKSGTPDPVVAGTTLTYSLVASNLGPSDATGVSVTDTLPGDVTFESASATQGSFDQATGMWSIGTLADGASATLTLLVTVDSDTIGSLHNTATITGNETDPTSTNNTTTVDTGVTTETDLAVAKAGTPDPVVAGTTLTYTVFASNLGPSDATGVSVTDTLPGDVTFESASATQGSFDQATGVWSIGTLADGASVTLTLLVTVDSDTIGTLRNRAAIAGSEADPVITNNTITADTSVVTDADLAVSKSDDPDPVAAGGTVTYVLTYHNYGPSDAVSVEIADTLPENVILDEILSVDPPIFSFEQDGQLLTWSAPRLATGATGTIVFSVIVDPAAIGTVFNDLLVSSATPDSNPENNHHVEDTDIGSPDLATIYGFVFEDSDGDGQWDAGEPPISDVLLTLDDSATAATRADGLYYFITNEPGLHTVVETDPLGYLSTTPNEQEVNVILGNSYLVSFGDAPAALCTCPPDVDEDNDTMEQAKPLGDGLLTRDFCDDATDWTSFTARAGSIYTVTTSAGGPDWYWGRRADTNLEILDAHGSVLAANDDYQGSDDYSSQVVWQARVSGVYYLRTTNRAGLYGCLTTYQVWLERLEKTFIYLPMVTRSYQVQPQARQGPKPSPTELEVAPTEQAPEEVFSPTGVISHTCADDYEVDDTWEVAHAVEFGTAQVHSFDSDPWFYSADKDFVWFDLKARETVTFTVTPVNETGTVLELYDGQGVALGVTGTTHLVWTATESGRYYLSVSPEPQATTSGCANEVGYELLPEIKPLNYVYAPYVLRSY